MNVSVLDRLRRNRSLLGIAVESGHLAVVRHRRTNGHSEATDRLQVPIAAEQILENPEEAGRQLAAALQDAGIHEHRCAVCVPPFWALISTTELPEMSGEDLQAFLALRAEREFPWPAADLRLAYSAYSLAGGVRRATLAALPTVRVNAVQRMLAAAGCRPVSISLGLDPCLQSAGDTGTLTFVANGNHVDLVICAGGGVIDLRSLNGAGAGETPAAVPDAATLEREVRITLGRLPEFVRREIGVTRFLGAPDSASALRAAAEAPLRRLGIERFDGGEADGRGVEPDVAGLTADHRLRGTPATFEFLPPRVEQWQRLLRRLSSRRNRILTIAIPALAGCVALILLVRGHLENRLERQWEAIAQDVGELEDIQNRIRQFRPWFDDAPLALSLLADLTEAFPETGEVWTRRIEIKENRTVAVAGMAGDHAALMAVLDRLRADPSVGGVQVRQLHGERPVQFAFSFVWADTRND